jgi:hypothetical protein
MADAEKHQRDSCEEIETTQQNPLPPPSHRPGKVNLVARVRIERRWEVFSTPDRLSNSFTLSTKHKIVKKPPGFLLILTVNDFLSEFNHCSSSVSSPLASVISLTIPLTAYRYACWSTLAVVWTARTPDNAVPA